MLRTASSLPLAGLLTLGSDAGRFPPTPPACYRASWQLPGPDFHRQATTSLRTKITHNMTRPPLCWAHEISGLVDRVCDCWALRFRQDLVCGFGPNEGVAAVVPA